MYRKMEVDKSREGGQLIVRVVSTHLYMYIFIGIYLHTNVYMFAHIHSHTAH